METFVNNTAVPLNMTKPMLDRRTVGGTTTTITSHRTTHGHCVAVQFYDTFEGFEQQTSAQRIFFKIVRRQVSDCVQQRMYP
jgi:hypothetical protein